MSQLQLYNLVFLLKAFRSSQTYLNNESCSESSVSLSVVHDETYSEYLPSYKFGDTCAHKDRVLPKESFTTDGSEHNSQIYQDFQIQTPNKKNLRRSSQSFINNTFYHKRYLSRACKTKILTREHNILNNGTMHFNQKFRDDEAKDKSEDHIVSSLFNRDQNHDLCEALDLSRKTYDNKTLYLIHEPCKRDIMDQKNIKLPDKVMLEAAQSLLILAQAIPRTSEKRLWRPFNDYEIDTPSSKGVDLIKLQTSPKTFENGEWRPFNDYEINTPSSKEVDLIKLQTFPKTFENRVWRPFNDYEIDTPSSKEIELIKLQTCSKPDSNKPYMKFSDVEQKSTSFIYSNTTNCRRVKHLKKEWIKKFVEESKKQESVDFRSDNKCFIDSLPELEMLEREKSAQYPPSLNKPQKLSNFNRQSDDNSTNGGFITSRIDEHEIRPYSGTKYIAKTIQSSRKQPVLSFETSFVGSSIYRQYGISSRPPDIIYTNYGEHNCSNLIDEDYDPLKELPQSNSSYSSNQYIPQNFKCANTFEPFFQPSDQQLGSSYLPSCSKKPKNSRSEGIHEFIGTTCNLDEEQGKPYPHLKTEGVEITNSKTDISIRQTSNIQDNSENFNNVLSSKNCTLSQSPPCGFFNESKYSTYVPTNMEEAVTHICNKISADEQGLSKEIGRLIFSNQDLSFIGDYMHKYYNEELKKKILVLDEIFDINLRLYKLTREEMRIRRNRNVKLKASKIRENKEKISKLQKQYNITENFIHLVDEIINNLNGMYIDDSKQNKDLSNNISYRSKSQDADEFIDKNSNLCQATRIILQASYLMRKHFPKRIYSPINSRDMIKKCCEGKNCRLYKKFQNPSRKDLTLNRDKKNHNQFPKAVHSNPHNKKSKILKCRMFAYHRNRNKIETLRRIFIHQLLNKIYSKFLLQ